MIKLKKFRHQVCVQLVPDHTSIFKKMKLRNHVDDLQKSKQRLGTYGTNRLVPRCTISYHNPDIKAQARNGIGAVSTINNSLLVNKKGSSKVSTCSRFSSTNTISKTETPLSTLKSNQKVHQNNSITNIQTVTNMNLKMINKVDTNRAKTTLTMLTNASKSKKIQTKKTDEWEEVPIKKVKKVKQGVITPPPPITAPTEPIIPPIQKSFIPSSIPISNNKQTSGKRDDESLPLAFNHRTPTSVIIDTKGSNNDINIYLLLKALLIGLQIADPTAFLGPVVHDEGNTLAIASTEDIPDNEMMFPTFVEDNRVTEKNMFVCRIYIHSNLPFPSFKANIPFKKWLKEENIMLERNILTDSRPHNVGFFINIIPNYELIETHEQRFRLDIESHTPCFQAIPKHLFSSGKKCVVLMIQANEEDVEHVSQHFHTLNDKSTDYRFYPWNQYNTLPTSKKLTIIMDQIDFCSRYRNIYIKGFVDNEDITKMWSVDPDKIQELSQVENNSSTTNLQDTLMEAEYDYDLEISNLDNNTKIYYGIGDTISHFDEQIDLRNIGITEYMMMKFTAGDGTRLFDYVYPSINGIREVLVTFPHYTEAMSLQKRIHGELARVMNRASIQEAFCYPHDAVNDALTYSPWIPFLIHQEVEPTRLPKKSNTKTSKKGRKYKTKKNIVPKIKKIPFKPTISYADALNSKLPLTVSTCDASHTMSRITHPPSASIVTKDGPDKATTNLFQEVYTRMASFEKDNKGLKLTIAELLSKLNNTSPSTELPLKDQEEIVHIRAEMKQLANSNETLDSKLVSLTNQLEQTIAPVTKDINQMKEQIKKIMNNNEKLDVQLSLLTVQLEESRLSVAADFARYEQKMQNAQSEMLQEIQQHQSASEHRVTVQIQDLKKSTASTDDMSKIRMMLEAQQELASKRETREAEEKERITIRDQQFNLYFKNMRDSVEVSQQRCRSPSRKKPINTENTAPATIAFHQKREQAKLHQTSLKNILFKGKLMPTSGLDSSLDGLTSTSHGAAAPVEGQS